MPESARECQRVPESARECQKQLKATALHSYTAARCENIFWGDWLCRRKWLHRCQPFKVDPVDPFRISFSQSKTSAGETRKPKAVWRIEQYWTYSDILLSTHSTHIMMLLPGKKKKVVFDSLWVRDPKYIQMLYLLALQLSEHVPSFNYKVTSVYSNLYSNHVKSRLAPLHHALTMHIDPCSSFSLFAHSCHRLGRVAGS